MDTTQLAQALKDRFEADRFFGVDALPVRIPTATPQGRSPARPSQSNQPVIRLQQLDDAAINERVERLRVIDHEEVKSCTKCGLHQTRDKTVFGVGHAAARLMFVGEGPGRDENASGEPFVGKAGQLLTKMIEAGMGLKREDVYICNIVKCWPPNNRNPAPDEVHACKNYLLRQIEIINPEVIVALGAPAAQTLLGTSDGIGRLRSNWHDFYVSGTRLVGDPIPVMPTYHPAYLLRSPDEKKKSWADLKMVMAKLGLPVPGR